MHVNKETGILFGCPSAGTVGWDPSAENYRQERHRTVRNNKRK